MVSFSLVERFRPAGTCHCQLPAFDHSISTGSSRSGGYVGTAEHRAAEAYRQGYDRSPYANCCPGIGSFDHAHQPEFPSGIAGPVAGKLSEEYYRPVIIVNVDEKTASASSRSIPEFNIINALNQCNGLLGRFGGHAQAAGFTMPAKNLGFCKRPLSNWPLSS